MQDSTIKNTTIKKAIITSEMLAEIKALEGREIDLSDAPEVLDWHNAKRGMFKFNKHYNGVQVEPQSNTTNAIDADVIEWVAHQDTATKRYINDMIRNYMSFRVATQ